MVIRCNRLFTDDVYKIEKAHTGRLENYIVESSLFVVY